MGGCDFQKARFSVPMTGNKTYDDNYDKIFRKKKKRSKKGKMKIVLKG